MQVQDAALSNEAVMSTAAGCWRFAAADAAAALDRPVQARLGELGVIAATGDDAARFLHGQLSSDIEHLGADRLALAGYCTPKGRLLATFRLWRDGSTIRLLLPRELLPGVLKRLSMFVLRAKARLSEESNAWTAHTVFGSGATAMLQQHFGVVPATAGESMQFGPWRLARLHGSARVADRFLLIGPANEALPAALRGAQAVDVGAFWWSEIDAGVPTIFAATQERFVPQMINFEVIGGVNFTKGCYPGQEVVARSQYRGKLRRRMFAAHGDRAAAAGADVFAAREGEPVGTVVMCATAPQSGFDLLLECTQEQAEGRLCLQGPGGPALELRALPYAIVDVTA